MNSIDNHGSATGRRMDSPAGDLSASSGVANHNQAPKVRTGVKAGGNWRLGRARPTRSRVTGARRKGSRRVIDANRRRMSGAVVALSVVVLALPMTKAADAAFPGTNGKIFFDTTRDGFTNIYSMDPNGSAQTAVVGNPVRNPERDPAVSPDGTRVAYERGDAIWVMNIDGSAPTRLTSPSGGSDLDPTWSPDGRRIAFTRFNDIWAMNADATGQVNLTNNPDNEERDPAWSPRGDKIAYTRGGCDVPRGGGFCVYVMNADGSAQTNLTPEKRRCDRIVGSFWSTSRQPAWSPDGQLIAFTGPSDCEENLFGGTEIWTMSPTGGGKTNLTHDTKADKDPAFSPDGRFIVFSSDRDNNDFEIYTITSSGGAITQLTNNTVRDERPDWAPRPRTSFAVRDLALAEGHSGTKAFGFTITRSGNTTGTSSVQWSTANGSAIAGTDYTAVALTTITFGPGETAKTVSVSVIGDTVGEANETFLVRLTSATGATIADGTGIGTILNDDSTSSAAGAGPVTDDVGER